MTFLYIRSILKLNQQKFREFSDFFYITSLFYSIRKDKIMSQLNEALDSFFHLKERGTTVRTELVAGATSFMTLAFLIAVHPSIMASCGMDKGAMATVTIVSAMIFTLICGLYCNIPFVLATAMGSNALIAYSIVGAGITTWQVALGMNFISGVIFVIISVCNIREMVVKVIPKGLKITMGAAVGSLLRPPACPTSS